MVSSRHLKRIRRNWGRWSPDSTRPCRHDADKDLVLGPTARNHVVVKRPPRTVYKYGPMLRRSGELHSGHSRQDFPALSYRREDFARARATQYRQWGGNFHIS